MVYQELLSSLEYNVRLGDPETQAVLPLMESDLAELCSGHRSRETIPVPAPMEKRRSMRPRGGGRRVPRIVSEGRPHRGGSLPILRTDEWGQARLFVAGANLDADALSCAMGNGATEGGVLRTSGGRVLSVSAWGADLNQAREQAYKAMEGVKFDGMGYRRDIGIEV